ncbi:interleukin-36 alpha-like [Notamacropus eugenii]|uniref:interleukin-36 alpha-like n=1 Tax=Notamacropus eugenii TaxID=9315 RepID=UPI003B66FCE1
MNRGNKYPHGPGSMHPVISQALAKPYVRGIRDTSQQVFVLQGKTLIAVAEDRMVHQITLTTTPCRDESLAKDKGKAIYLGIADHTLCLCCAEDGGQPALKLEERDIMELYHAPKAEKSFVFYQNANGNSSTFESATYPGWFISSSRENGKPIRMTKNVAKDNINFYFHTRIEPGMGQIA